MYKLRYLPLALKDLEAITDALTAKFKTTKAAARFINSIENELSQLSANPHNHRIYQPLKPITAEYRALPVQNYLIFYLVSGNAIEIHRAIYARRKLPQAPKGL